MNPDQPVRDLIMRRMRRHMALVRTADGQLGMVTLEDVLEALVGDIADDRRRRRHRRHHLVVTLTAVQLGGEERRRERRVERHVRRIRGDRRPSRPGGPRGQGSEGLCEGEAIDAVWSAMWSNPEISGRSTAASESTARGLRNSSVKNRIFGSRTR